VSKLVLTCYLSTERGNGGENGFTAGLWIFEGDWCGEQRE
jgi:hypothetical protein